jgi:hypothetical protein
VKTLVKGITDEVIQSKQQVSKRIRREVRIFYKRYSHLISTTKEVTVEDIGYSIRGYDWSQNL